MVQELLEPVHVVAVAQQVQQHPGVDVTGPGTHDQPLERGQAHGGVQGCATAYGRGGGAVAEVQHDQGQLFLRTPEEPGGLPRDVRVADPVRAVPADAQPLAHVPVHGVRRGRGGQPREERGVEDRNLPQVGERRAGRADAGQGRGVVQRRQRHELLDPALDLVVHQRGIGVAIPAVHHPMTDGQQVAGVDTGLGHRRGDLVEGVVPSGLVDPFHGPAGHGLLAGVQHLVLQRGGTSVEDQYGAGHAVSLIMWPPWHQRGSERPTRRGSGRP